MNRPMNLEENINQNFHAWKNIYIIKNENHSPEKNSNKYTHFDLGTCEAIKLSSIMCFIYSLK